MDPHKNISLLTLLLFSALGLCACDSGPELGVEMVWYKGATITPESVQGPGIWTASVDSVFRHVTLQYTEPDSTVMHQLTLHEIEGELPAYAGYTHLPGSDRPGGLRSGTIQIQKFDLNGEISGIFEGSLTHPLGGGTGGIFYLHLRSQSLD